MPCTLPASLADAAVCRGSFHAVLGGEAGEAVFADFSAALQKAQAEGRILTASLFRYENHLFFYAEGLNRPFTPQGLCPALDAALLPWPPALGEAAPRPWAAMQPYFYHDVPTTAADWQQGRCPQRRRGRIALLPPDSWCSYMEHHLRIVTEGLVEGDRWHLICVQEGVLFSYLEEPRTNVNIKHRPARTALSWTHGSPPTPKAILHALRRSRRPTRTAATTLYFCPALRERRTEL